MASSNTPEPHSLHPRWVHAWSLASRASVTQGTSRAACMVLDVILRLRLLPLSDVAETMKSMLVSAELNGPSILCDSSVMLWTRVLEIAYQLGSNYAIDAPRQVCNWMRSSWSIGTLMAYWYSCSGSFSCSSSSVTVCLPTFRDLK
jgi:serine-protein kinase ATM